MIFSFRCLQILSYLIQGSFALILGTTPCYASEKMGAGTIHGAHKNEKLCSAGHLCASPAFQQAVELFRAQNYSKALESFALLDSQGSSSALVRYYMALCCHYTEQMEAAEQHYDWVIAHTDNADLRAKATSGLELVKRFNAHRFYRGQGRNYYRPIAAAGVVAPAAPPIEYG